MPCICLLYTSHGIIGIIRSHQNINRFPAHQHDIGLCLSLIHIYVKLEDEERAAAIEKITNYITRFGGTVTNIDEWGKKRLAYEIQKMKEGYYYFIQFDGNSTTPNELESRVRIMEPVIRYLCVRQEA